MGSHNHGNISRDVELERHQLEASGCSSRELEAFKFAAVAEDRHNQGSVPDCWHMAFNSLVLNPVTPDAHRILCLVLTPLHIAQMIDNSTVDGLLRESLFFLRHHLADRISKGPYQGTNDVRIRPFVRFLMAMGGVANMIERVDSAILVLEEVLRIDHEDHMFARESLILCYLKVIGRRDRGELVYITRTVEHLNALLDCHFENSQFPLFDRAASTKTWHNEDLMILRWAEIFLKFRDNDKLWIDLVRAESELCPWIFQFLFDEVPKAPKPFTRKGDYVQRNANRISDRLLVCLHDWPDFIITMYRELRAANRDSTFEIRILKQAPHTLAESTREGKHHFAALGDQFLDKGREALSNRRYEEAFSLLTVAKRSCTEGMKPDLFWFVNAPFQMISNRAMATERLGYWNLCRHDTRLTLFLKNDHMKSYERLPLIANRYLASALREELQAFVAKLKMSPPGSASGWNQAAKTAIALISISGIMASIAGNLTQELRQELIAVGVDDMFTSVTISEDVLERLPWLDNDI